MADANQTPLGGDDTLAGDDASADASDVQIDPVIGGEDTIDATGPRPALSRPARAVARGDIVGFVVVGKLGAGGMGVVYAAYDPELDRKVALKFLLPHGADREAARVRLHREAQAMAKLTHPNVVAVHDVGVQADRVWVAMEFVEGKTLTQ